MKQLNRLHDKLLDEDDLDISDLHVTKDPSDNIFNISILWKLKVNRPKMLDTIVDQFEAFTDFLNTLSKT